MSPTNTHQDQNLLGSLLHVKIQTPEGMVWEGNAQAVSSRNSVGPFDILPEHSNFITLIEAEPVTILTDSGSQDFAFKRAIISLQDNIVSIYADIALSKNKTSDVPNTK